tara:strand:+ start:5029 stop:5289 length:261 start_codon:yes stop_codon:yes gene_type:complete
MSALTPEEQLEDTINYIREAHARDEAIIVLTHDGEYVTQRHFKANPPIGCDMLLSALEVNPIYKQCIGIYRAESLFDRVLKTEGSA